MRLFNSERIKQATPDERGIDPVTSLHSIIVIIA